MTQRHRLHVDGQDRAARVLQNEVVGALVSLHVQRGSLSTSVAAPNVAPPSMEVRGSIMIRVMAEAVGPHIVVGCFAGGLTLIKRSRCFPAGLKKFPASSVSLGEWAGLLPAVMARVRSLLSKR